MQLETKKKIRLGGGIGTIAGVVAILSWMGIEPKPSNPDETYVTHEQFTVLTAGIQKSIDVIAAELESMSIDIAMSTLIEDTPSSDDNTYEKDMFSVIREPASVHSDPIFIEPSPPLVDAIKDPKLYELNNAIRQIETMQMEQRALRK